MFSVLQSCVSHMHMCVYCEHLTTPRGMEYITVQLHIFWRLMCLLIWYRMASMPCTWLHKVGIGKSSNSCTVTLEQGSMTETTTMTPCCTGLPFPVTVGWHVTSLKNSGWIRRTGTRCEGRWRMRSCSHHSRPVCAIILCYIISLHSGELLHCWVLLLVAVFW